MLGIMWLGVSLFDFVKTPYLSSRKRELLSDYALPVAVFVFSTIGSVVINKIQLDPFKFEGILYCLQSSLWEPSSLQLCLGSPCPSCSSWTRTSVPLLIPNHSPILKYLKKMTGLLPIASAVKNAISVASTQTRQVAKTKIKKHMHAYKIT